MDRFLSILLILILLLPGILVNAEEVDNEYIILSIAGDVMMDSSVRSQVNKHGYDYPWEMVKEHFQKSHLGIVNLETSITRRGTKWPDKAFNFRSDPKNLNPMKEAGVDVVTLANNHILDYGNQGFIDTLDHLKRRSIPYAGGGRNKAEALEGTIIEKEGVKIGVLSFSRVVPDVRWYATNKRPGIVGAYDCCTQDMMKRIKEMKEEVDILVLSLHWGVERSTKPRKQEIAVAKNAIDAGADVIMGHHPHVLQGIEIYKDKPIFYSLGNFVFGGRDKLTRTTMIGQINIKDKQIHSVEIIPCKIVNGRPVFVIEKEKAQAINYIRNLSKPFKTSINKDGIINIAK